MHHLGLAASPATVHTRQVHQAQLAARSAMDTTDFQARYALRAGVEGTIRQGASGIWITQFSSTTIFSL